MVFGRIGRETIGRIGAGTGVSLLGVLLRFLGEEFCLKLRDKVGADPYVGIVWFGGRLDAKFDRGLCVMDCARLCEKFGVIAGTGVFIISCAVLVDGNA